MTFCNFQREDPMAERKRVSFVLPDSARDNRGYDCRWRSNVAATLAAIATLLVWLIPHAAEAALPDTPGWYEIPNTKIRPVCPVPSPGGVDGCSAVVAAWSGGAADTSRNRLIIWGGGHADYTGNEIYELDLEALNVSRLTEPSPTTNVQSCPEAYPDGNPVSRHTYGGLEYMPNVDEMFAIGGSKSSCGEAAQHPWTFDLESLKWTDVNTAGEPPGVYEEIAAYDPNTQRVLIGYPNSGGWFSLWSYDPSTNGYVPLNQADQATSYGTSGVIDPDRKLFLVVGNGRFLAVDISGKDSAYNAVDWSAQVASCGAMIAQPDPGLAYDAAQKLVVAWNGGNSVYLFNPETKSCTTQTFPGGPPAPTGGGGPTGQMAAGTFGRFRYFPKLNVFAVVNDVDQNGFVLRLSTGEPPVGTDAGADPLDADMGSPDVGHSVPPRGCGCSLYQASPTPGWWIVGAAAALLAWSRRRRRELRGAMGWLHTTIGKAPKIRLK